METYRFCEKNGLEMFMKFATWERETHDKKYRNDPFRSVNFRIDEDGNPVCPGEKKFFRQKEMVIKGNKDHRTAEKYVCENCEGCPLREQCHKGKGNRVINVNRELTGYHEKVIENLGSDRGIELRQERSAMAEGAFGILKQDYQFRRLSRVTLKKVNMEFYLVMIGFNLRKYCSLKNRKKEMMS